MTAHWLRLMYREALERLDDAEALKRVRPDSNASYLLELIAFELLLKFTAYTAEPANIARKKSFRHDYKKIFDALPPLVQRRLLALAGERIGPSGLVDRDKVFADWTTNFDGLRYPFEKYENDTTREYVERGRTWLSEGGRLEDATFRFHAEELLGMLYALNVEAHERLRQLPKGRTAFSASDAERVRTLLREVRDVDRDRQKALRDRLRNELGFYISDFTKSNRGFGPDDFDELEKRGTIRIA